VSSPLKDRCRGAAEETLVQLSSGCSIDPEEVSPPTSVDLVLHRVSCSLAVPKPCGVQLGCILKSSPESRQLHSPGTLTMTLAVGPAPARGAKIQPSAEIWKRRVNLHLAYRCEGLNSSGASL